MINTYQEKRKLALTQLKLALKHNQFDWYVMGDPATRITKHYEDGTEDYDITFTVNAIYDYYNENRNSGIDQLFYQTLLNEANTNLSSKILADLLDIIRYQMYKEYAGESPFKIDCRSLLEAMRNNITKNRDRYITRTISRPTPINKNLPDYYEEVTEDIKSRFSK